MFGTENQNEMIPISYTFDDSANVVAQVYKGEGRATEKKTIPLADVVYALSITNPVIKVNGNQAIFTTYNEKQQTALIAELKRD